MLPSRKQKKEYKKVHRSNISNVKVNVLLEEYRNIHNRVLNKFQEIERISFQVIIAIGVVLYFCINSFTNTDNYISLFVDLCIVLLIPILSFSLVFMVLSAYVEVAAFGEYLIFVERKINIIFNKSIYGNHENNTLNWEYRRINHGIVKEKLIFFNRAFIVFFVFIGTFIISIIRLSYIEEHPEVIPDIILFPGIIHENYRMLLIFFIVILYVMMLVVIFILMCKLYKRRKEQERLLGETE
jgi:hypothetical protein